MNFSCYTCGGSKSSEIVLSDEEGDFTANSISAVNSIADNASIMKSFSKRVSMSRRSEHMENPPMRSRSSERYLGQTQNDHSGSDTNTDNNDNDNSRAPIVSQTTYDDDEVEKGQANKGSKSHSNRHHRRAMSDPFDNPEDVPNDDLNNNGMTSNGCSKTLQTLPRFPVAETRNQNCWGVPPVDIFHVRGAKYLEGQKKKIQSGPYILGTRGCDLFLADPPITLKEKYSCILGGILHHVPTLVVNFRFPWGHLLLYWEITEQLVPYLRDKNKKINSTDAPLETPALQTLAKWLQGDEDYKNDRLKLIPYVAEGPWVVRNMVTGRPAIIGRKLPVTYTYTPATEANPNGDVLECVLDIGSSSNTAKRIVSVCRRYMSALTVDIGFVIQGESSDELPEQMLGSCRIHGVDPLKAAKLN